MASIRQWFETQRRAPPHSQPTSRHYSNRYGFPDQLPKSFTAGGRRLFFVLGLEAKARL
jgi:hypothetical protein